MFYYICDNSYVIKMHKLYNKCNDDSQEAFVDHCTNQN